VKSLQNLALANWCKQTPLWQYVMHAVVIYSREAAEWLAVPVEDVARRIAARHDVKPSRDQLWSRGRPPGGRTGPPPGRIEPPGVTNP
jgi:hypothetical protein